MASVVHPVERRKFTIAELRRICVFPDDFVLVGSYAQQWARLGNAVPPVMMMRIATVVREDILARISGAAHAERRPSAAMDVESFCNFTQHALWPGIRKGARLRRNINPQSF